MRNADRRNALGIDRRFAGEPRDLETVTRGSAGGGWKSVSVGKQLAGRLPYSSGASAEIVAILGENDEHAPAINVSCQPILYGDKKNEGIVPRGTRTYTIHLQMFGNMTMREIYVTSHRTPAELIKTELGAALSGNEDITLEIRDVPGKLRGVDPTMLVAVVGAMGAAFATLLGGVLKVAAAREAKKVIILGRTGRRIEVPSDTRPEDLDEYLKKAREIDVDQIELGY